MGLLCSLCTFDIIHIVVCFAHFIYASCRIMVFVYRCILRNEIINKHGFTLYFFMISIVSYFAHIHKSKGMKLLRHTWAALLCIFFFIISIVRYFAHFIYAPSCMFSYMHVS